MSIICPCLFIYRLCAFHCAIPGFKLKLVDFKHFKKSLSKTAVIVYKCQIELIIPSLKSYKTAYLDCINHVIYNYVEL